MKKILEFSAFIYAFLIFIGYSYLDTYYRFFFIPIYSFLDSSEILLCFLKNINYIFFFSFILGVSSFVFTVLTSKKKLQVSSEDQKLKKKSDIRFIIYTLIVFGFIIFDIAHIIFLIKKDFISSLLAFLLIIVCALLIYVYFRLPKFLEGMNIKISAQIQQICMIVIFGCSLNYLGAYINYKQVNERLVQTKFSFKYESENYCSSDSLIFIGITSKYIFLKKTNTKENYIFEKEKISHLILSDKYF